MWLFRSPEPTVRKHRASTRTVADRLQASCPEARSAAFLKHHTRLRIRNANVTNTEDEADGAASAAEPSTRPCRERAERSKTQKACNRRLRNNEAALRSARLSTHRINSAERNVVELKSGMARA